MSAIAMMAVQRGMQTQQAAIDAFNQQAMAEFQAENIGRQMDEIELRTRIQTQNIYKQAERVQANQIAAYVGGGVEITGSAMSVLNDTLNEAAQAAYIRQRESDYELVGLAMQEAAYEDMASNQTLLLNLASAVANGATGVAADAYKNNNGSLRNMGAGGRGIQQSDGNMSAYNQTSNSAEGIS